MDIFVGVAAHKPYPIVDMDGYHPIQVGAKGKNHIKGYLPDDQGDNISDLNANFSELTGAYFIWKNVDARYKGLVHYRRYFGMHRVFTHKINDVLKKVLTESQMRQLLKTYDVIVPRERKYYIESNYSHYSNAHNSDDLDETRKVISNISPEYLKDFDKVMDSNSAHMFNMYIMKQPIFDEYHRWLFTILSEVRNRIDITSYSTQEARVFGYISELLLDVWLYKNKVKYTELPVLYTEKEHIIKKAFGLLYRKVHGSGRSHIKSSID